MRIRPEEPHWPDRDRFVLSKGHSAIALYTVLAHAGLLPHRGAEHLRRHRLPAPGPPRHERSRPASTCPRGPWAWASPAAWASPWAAAPPARTSPPTSCSATASATRASSGRRPTWPSGTPWTTWWPSSTTTSCSSSAGAVRAAGQPPAPLHRHPARRPLVGLRLEGARDGRPRHGRGRLHHRGRPRLPRRPGGHRRPHHQGQGGFVHGGQLRVAHPGAQRRRTQASRWPSSASRETAAAQGGAA